MKTAIIRSFFAVASITTITTVAQAGDSARSDQRATASLIQGVGTSSLPLLARQVGNPDTTLATLLRSLHKDALPFVRDDKSDRVRISGDNWHLEVIKDGTAGEFSDDAVRAKAFAQGAPTGLSDAVLETAGRDFISKNLSGIIALQPGETLALEATTARTVGGHDSRGIESAVLTTGNRVLFTREINGVPVLGAGSKVAVTFLNDGSVESFSYDWPMYLATSRMQETASVGDILQRVQLVVGARAASRATQPVVLPSNPSVSNPVDLGANMQLERFSCGYYDAGVVHRDPGAPVQTGCYYHAVHSALGAGIVLRAAFSGAVPAALQAEADSRWPEAMLLRGVVSSGTVAPPSAPGPSPGSQASDGKK
jgi:hypothetical protein